MSKIYNKERGTVRLVRKTGNVNENFRGRHADQIESEMAAPLRCKYCGQSMTVFKDHANIAIWSCNTPFCVNNPNNPVDFDITNDFINKAGNVYNTWDFFRPRKII